MHTILSLASLIALTACGTPISAQCRTSAGGAPSGMLRSEPVTVTGPLACASRALDAGHVVCRLANGTGAEVWVGVDGKGPEEYVAGTDYSGRTLVVNLRLGSVSVSTIGTSMTIREVPNQNPRTFELNGIGCDVNKGISANAFRVVTAP